LPTKVKAEKAASQRLGAFHVDCGAARKTERSEGNPAAVQGLHFQMGVARKTEHSEGTPGVVTKIYTDLISKPCKLYDLRGFAFTLTSFELN